jgi:hypothetical protein
MSRRTRFKLSPTNAERVSSFMVKSVDKEGRANEVEVLDKDNKVIQRIPNFSKSHTNRIEIDDNGDLTLKVSGNVYDVKGSKEIMTELRLKSVQGRVIKPPTLEEKGYQKLTDQEKKTKLIKRIKSNKVVRRKVERSIAQAIQAFGAAGAQEGYLKKEDLYEGFKNKKGGFSIKKLLTAFEDGTINIDEGKMADIFMSMYSVHKPIEFVRDRDDIYYYSKKDDTYKRFAGERINNLFKFLQRNLEEYKNEDTVYQLFDNILKGELPSLKEAEKKIKERSPSKREGIRTEEEKKETPEQELEREKKETMAELATAKPAPVVERPRNIFVNVPDEQLESIIRNKVLNVGIKIPPSEDNPRVQSIMRTMIKDLRGQGDGDGVLQVNEIKGLLRGVGFDEKDYIVGAVQPEQVQARGQVGAGVKAEPVKIPEGGLVESEEEKKQKDDEIGQGWHSNQQNKGTQRPKFITPSVNVLQPSEQDIQADFDEWAIFDFVQPVNNYGTEGNLNNNPLKRMARVEEETRFRNAGIDLQPALSSVFTNREVNDNQSQLALDMLPPLMPDTSNQPRQVYNVSEYEVKSYDVNNDRTAIEYQSPYDNMTPIVLTNDQIRRSVLYGRVP